MINIQKYRAIKAKYGHVASWALWSESASSDTSDIEMFDDHLVPLDFLHARFVFVGLNISQPIAASRPFGNFHGGKRDFMLRDAIEGTSLEGAYMTDLIKLFPDPSAASVVKHFKKSPHQLNFHLTGLRSELNDVGSDDETTLIALGNDCFKFLCEHVRDRCVVKLTHYAATISKVKYRDEVNSILSGLVSARS
jgi:hypothetical protein